MPDESEWIWMPHAGHLIVGQDCRYHLATKVGEVIVSTVGEYLPDSSVREVLAESRGIKLKGRGDERRADYMKQIGFEDIGFDRKYETMVFRAEKDTERSCCPWRMANGMELDMNGYNDPAEAFEGHLEMCRKWAARPLPEPEEEL